MEIGLVSGVLSGQSASGWSGAATQGARSDL